MSFEETSCDICGSGEFDVFLNGKDRLHHFSGSFPLVVCRDCGLIYLNPRPDQATLSEYYPENYTPFSSGQGMLGRLQTFLRKLEAAKIGRQVSGHKVLEIGCASGDLLVPLREKGFSVSGVEMSDYAVSLARDTHHLKVLSGTIFDVPDDFESVDAVVMRHVIEHFPSARKALEKTRILLKDEGLLFITTPNFDSIDRRTFGRFWHNYEPPRHLAVFSVSTLTKLLQSTGFEVVRVRHSFLPNDWIHSTRYVLEEYLGRRKVFEFFSIKNPILLILFLPFSIIQKILRKSGRIEVIAKKGA